VQTSPCKIPCPCQKAGLKREITKVGFVFANVAYLVTQNDNLIIKTSEDEVPPFYSTRDRIKPIKIHTIDFDNKAVRDNPFSLGQTSFNIHLFKWIF
jgi:hypothetical protein